MQDAKPEKQKVGIEEDDDEPLDARSTLEFWCVLGRNNEDRGRVRTRESESESESCDSLEFEERSSGCGSKGEKASSPSALAASWL